TVAGKVDPDAAVFLFIEDSFLETGLDKLFAEQIGIALVINFIEVAADATVGQVKTGIDPAVHRPPQLDHLGPPSLPVDKHLLSGLHDRRFLFGLFFFHTGSHQLSHFLFMLIAEKDIIVSDKMIAFDAGAGGGSSIAITEPGDHALAYMDAAVI